MLSCSHVLYCMCSVHSCVYSSLHLFCFSPLVELAMIMDRLYGGVCYAGIDTDPELKYPKGAGRVAFSNQQSYIAAISARFVQLQHNDIDKRVSALSTKSFSNTRHKIVPYIVVLCFFAQACFLKV